MHQLRGMTVRDDVTGDVIGAVCQRATGFEAWLRLRLQDRPARTHILLTINDDETAAVLQVKARMLERQLAFNRIWAEIQRGDYAEITAQSRSLGLPVPADMPEQLSDDAVEQAMTIPVAEGEGRALVVRTPGHLWFEHE